MKIFKSFMLAALVAFAALSLNSCTNTQGILWNVKASAAGEGKITVSYPTGNPGLVVEGNATAVATTTNDTTTLNLLASDGTFAVPNGGLLAVDVVANPDEYSKDEVKDAQKLLDEASAVKFKAEGKWKASVVGYAKYGQIYVVIDEHWPADTTAVAAPVDTIAVAE